MCKPDQQIHFCSCASVKPIPYPFEEFDPKEYVKTRFIWKLNRYIGEVDSGMLGEMIMPLQRLGVELTTGRLIIELTRKDIFDFDYKAKEGDELIIREEYLYKGMKGKKRPERSNYLSLIYREGSWQDDFYNIFSEKTRRFKQGVIEIES